MWQLDPFHLFTSISKKYVFVYFASNCNPVIYNLFFFKCMSHYQCENNVCYYVSLSQCLLIVHLNNCRLCPIWLISPSLD